MRLVLCSHSRRSEFPITRACLLGLCALVWRLVLYGWLWPSRRRLFGTVGNCSESGNVIVCRRCIILSFFFVHCKCHLYNAFSAKSPVGDMQPGMGSCGRLAANVMGAYLGVLFWRCGLMIGSASRRVLTGLGSPVRSREEKKLLLGAEACAQKACRFRLLFSKRSFAVLAWMCT